MTKRVLQIVLFSAQTSMAHGGKIVVVGLCCLDIVNYVDGFPVEDSDRRVFEQTTSLGGNATNTVTVLRQILANAGGGGAAGGCELFAALPSACENTQALLRKQSIPAGRCVHRGRNFDPPVSTIIVNRENGSRTILHYRGTVPEPSAEEFWAKFGDDIRRGQLGWIHFEGRNFDETQKMMQFVRAERSNESDLLLQPNLERPQISLELEKIRDFPWYEPLIPLADVLFMSKDFARARGWNSMVEAVAGLQREFSVPSTTVICPWGEEGAAGRLSTDADLVVVPATPVQQAVDTTGAGDAFIGASLYHLNKGGATLREVLLEATRIAGLSVAQKGLLNLPISSLSSAKNN